MTLLAAASDGQSTEREVRASHKNHVSFWFAQRPYLQSFSGLGEDRLLLGRVILEMLRSPAAAPSGQSRCAFHSSAAVKMRNKGLFEFFCRQAFHSILGSVLFSDKCLKCGCIGLLLDWSEL